MKTDFAQPDNQNRHHTFCNTTKNKTLIFQHIELCEIAKISLSGQSFSNLIYGNFMFFITFQAQKMVQINELKVGTFVRLKFVFMKF
ncbi:Hypothetical protein Ccan_08020 [Capnocytophaga canimorsus Cc5]|uniref:Uncharacterized protein n=1 Tax=Capnocytophaga canimorsus (strain 5) TaxID=860228 RepID=F9YTY6_CAPCC|nr:Hypothetical protein Ccan_08020 [Capnocytophaga canimorsus Cc5]